MKHHIGRNIMEPILSIFHLSWVIDILYEHSNRFLYRSNHNSIINIVLPLLRICYLQLFRKQGVQTGKELLCFWKINFHPKKENLLSKKVLELNCNSKPFIIKDFTMLLMDQMPRNSLAVNTFENCHQTKRKFY